MALTAAQVLVARRRISLEVIGNAPATVTKADIDGSVAACVAWVEANAASVSTAIAGTALAGASAAVKAQVLAIAIETRFGP